MTAFSPTETFPGERPPPNLDQFLNRFLEFNPFVASRVLQPSTAPEDAEAIHQAAFRRLVELAELARNERLGVGVMLWGEAGVGKSHLLARLARWAGQSRRACFVYFHNLQARAESLPRYVLHCVVSNLTLGRADRFHETPLFWLANAAVKAALEGRQGPPPTWLEVEKAFDRWLDRLVAGDPARAPLTDRAAYQVLLRFFQSAYKAQRTGAGERLARLGSLWLAGDTLEPVDARLLNLPADVRAGDGVAIRDDQHVKQVLIALAQIALCRQQTLVLAFDQVDNLEADQVAALARFLQALLDSTPNLFVVTSGVQEGLLRFHEDKVIQDSSWDRLAQFEVALHRVSADEARQIAGTRLKAFIQPYLGLDPVRRRWEKDALFPLGTAWFEDALGDKTAVRPRDVVTWTRQGWHREQEALRRLGGPRWLETWGERRTRRADDLPGATLDEVIDRKVDQKIQEHRAQRQREPQTLPPDADNLAGLVYTLLQQCRDQDEPPAVREVRRVETPKNGPRPSYHLLVRQQEANGRERTTGLIFLATANANSTAACLRRLLLDAQPPERVFVITEERRPLALGPQGKKHLERLRCRSAAAFRHIEIAFTDYAGLDALQAAVRMARSGDLEVEWPPGQTRPVSEPEVIRSHQRRRRYHRYSPLRDLWGAAMPEEAEGPPPFTPDEKDAREFILGRLAASGAQSSATLAEQYAAYLGKTRSARVAVPACKAAIEEVARHMDRDGLIGAAAREDGLYLLPRP